MNVDIHATKLLWCLRAKMIHFTKCFIAYKHKDILNLNKQVIIIEGDSGSVIKSISVLLPFKYLQISDLGQNTSKE